MDYGITPLGSSNFYNANQSSICSPRMPVVKNHDLSSTLHAGVGSRGWVAVTGTHIHLQLRIHLDHYFVPFILQRRTAPDGSAAPSR